MTSSTAEYWEIDGTSLSQYAWNITTFGGSPRGFPPLRGSDITFAYRSGQAFRPKVADSRKIQLQMWVIGIDPTTDAFTNDSHLQWSDNWRALQRLFWNPSGQLALTRRWNTSDGLQTATALCQIDGDMAPEMRGRAGAEFTVDLLLADPYFYGEEETQLFELNDELTITNLGDVTTTGYGCQIDFDSGLIDPTLNNSTFTRDNWCRYVGTLASDVNLDLLNSIAHLADNSVVTGKIQSSGEPQWLQLLPGDNTVSFTGTGTGTALLTWRPAYV